MSSAVKEFAPRHASTTAIELPPKMRLLLITSGHRVGGWLADAFVSESGADVTLEEVVGVSAGLARLRDDAFDAILLGHEPGLLDSVKFVEGMRGGGSDEPVVVMGAQSEQEMLAPCFEAGADGYVCVNTVTTRTLLCLMVRAMQRRRLMGDYRRLARAEHHRLQQERDETRRLLSEQCQVVEGLVALQDGCGLYDPPGGDIGDKFCRDDNLPAELISHYRDLLRAHVIMGSGNLAREAYALANLLVSADVMARQVMRLHLLVLDELVAGLGNRSTRHVMMRADMLVLEVLAHLAEGYRRRYRERQAPPRQLALPGFDAA